MSVVLKAEDMHCEKCVERITKAMKAALPVKLQALFFPVRPDSRLIKENRIFSLTVGKKNPHCFCLQRRKKVYNLIHAGRFCRQ